MSALCFAGTVGSAGDSAGSYRQFHDRHIHPSIRDETAERHFRIQQYVKILSCDCCKDVMTKPENSLAAK